jgi:RNA polymerase sigma-70 factor (ECF subfamily)
VGPDSGVDRDSDRDLVQRVCAGDTDAFAVLVQRHQVDLLRLVSSFAATPEDAEDAVQEAFVAAFRQLDGFRGEASFRTWVGRIAIYRAMALAKRRSPQLRQHADLDRAAETPDVAEALAMREAVQALPEEMRVVVILRFWHGMSGREIAELSGIEQSTVWTRIYRGLDRIRKRLEGEERR